jgi:predicted nucleic acid-binding protein
MKLSDIPTGSKVFVDANVPLAVIFEEKNAPIAEDFLGRIESEEIIGVTSVVVINEIFHLLSNDATHIALMAKNEIRAMASFDHDLERVDCIELYGQA